jgi:hypothetical protein
MIYGFSFIQKIYLIDPAVLKNTQIMLLGSNWFLLTTVLGVSPSPTQEEFDAFFEFFCGK